MKHLLYLERGDSICERPDGLDALELIKFDSTTKGDSCKDCSAILFAHNNRLFKAEGELTITHNKRLLHEDDPTSLVRGFLTGCVFSTGFYVALYMLLHFLFGWL